MTQLNIVFWKYGLSNWIKATILKRRLSDLFLSWKRVSEVGRMICFCQQLKPFLVKSYKSIVLYWAFWAFTLCANKKNVYHCDAQWKEQKWKCVDGSTLTPVDTHATSICTQEMSCVSETFVSIQKAHGSFHFLIAQVWIWAYKC